MGARLYGRIGCYLAGSITRLEGHHRDGPAVQLWGRPPLFERRFVVALGVGLYRHFDTQADEQSRQRKPAQEKPEYVLRESINYAFHARIADTLDYLKNQYEISNKKQLK